MQREIKFRIWDKQNKKFVSSPHSHFHLLGQEEYVFQQFVGGQDSFGSDIYEGDILMAEETKNTYEISFSNEYFKYVAYFSGGLKKGFSVDLRSIFDDWIDKIKKSYDLKLTRNGKIKIIGHIFE